MLRRVDLEPDNVRRCALELAIGRAHVAFQPMGVSPARCQTRAIITWLVLNTLRCVHRGEPLQASSPEPDSSMRTVMLHSLPSQLSIADSCAPMASGRAASSTAP
jgi:hypothetical protein